MVESPSKTKGYHLDRSKCEVSQGSLEGILPILLSAAAAIMMLCRPHRGEIRIIDAVFLTIARDSLILAVGLHALVVGAVIYGIMRVIGRTIRPIIGALACVIAFIVYAVMYMTWGAVMVG